MPAHSPEDQPEQEARRPNFDGLFLASRPSPLLNVEARPGAKHQLLKVVFCRGTWSVRLRNRQPSMPRLVVARCQRVTGWLTA